MKYAKFTNKCIMFRLPGGVGMKKLCVDLCCGLGGFSQAFEGDSDWEVVKIDINPKVRPTIVADVRYLPLRQNLEPDVLLASPPCERFSVGNRAWPKIGIKRAMETVGAVFEAVAWLKPKYWLVENPMGRLRWFLGTPQQTLRLCDYGAPWKKLTDLWGNISLPLIKAQHRPITTVSNAARDPLKRAFLPHGFSEAVKEAVENSNSKLEA